MPEKHLQRRSKTKVFFDEPVKNRNPAYSAVPVQTGTGMTTSYETLVFKEVGNKTEK
jgi:hypothetical protein